MRSFLDFTIKWRSVPGLRSHSTKPRQKGMNTDGIAFSVRKTKRFVKEYEKIIGEYKEKSYILEKLLNLEIGIDTQTEQLVNNMS